MGLLRSIIQTGHAPSACGASTPPHTQPRRAHICRFEQFEARLPMAADLHVGSVYYEQAGGDDAAPNLIQFTFEGGAANTQLTRIIIDGDKDGLGTLVGRRVLRHRPGRAGVVQIQSLSSRLARRLRSPGHAGRRRRDADGDRPGRLRCRRKADHQRRRRRIAVRRSANRRDRHQRRGRGWRVPAIALLRHLQSSALRRHHDPRPVLGRIRPAVCHG